MNWLRISFIAALAVALAGGLRRLLGLERERLAGFPLLAFFSAAGLVWSELRAPEIGTGAGLFLVCVIAGAAAFWVARGRSAAALGALVGLIFSAQGFCAWRWAQMIPAFRRLDMVFAAAALRLGLPAALAASGLLVAAALLHADFQGLRARFVLGVLLAWTASCGLVEWRLRAAWDFGAAGLAQAAGLPEGPAAEISVAVLRPGADGAYGIARRRQQVGEIDAVPENLERVGLYLKERAYRTVFRRQAAALLRQGWRLWWETDRILAADALRAPGIVPDYRDALGIVRAGPLTAERFAALQDLSDRARADSAGFEDVNLSQLQFEAFAAAFARFDDETGVLYWLGRVDNLWPINDKKPEVAPLEAFREGEIVGRLLRDGRPASAVRVGLFLETSTAAASSALLGASQFPDSAGNFRFENLGRGRYHLELMAPTGVLRRSLTGSPGVIEISESDPVARLGPIRL
jgi:hypothetical protein